MPQALAAGHLTRRVTFDRPYSVSDGHHGTEDGWTAGALTVWAHIAYLRGGEGVIAGRLAGKQPAVVTMYRSEATREIATTWRMRDEDGRVFAVREAPKPSQDRRFVEMLVEAGVGS